MKKLASLFADSANELKSPKTLAVCGMMMALSIVLRFLAIPVTPDIRISFSYLGIVIIAMLYGPIPSVVAYIGSDIIGYLIADNKLRDYNLLLLLVVILQALIYGVLLYRTEKIRCIVSLVTSRAIVVLLCNIVLNTCVMYGCYVNTDFPFLAGTEWNAFWLYLAPRAGKALFQFPFDIILLLTAVPAAMKAYRMVGRTA